MLRIEFQIYDAVRHVASGQVSSEKAECVYDETTSAEVSRVEKILHDIKALMRRRSKRSGRR